VKPLSAFLIGAMLAVSASAAPQKVEQRLQQLEDREQIRELLAEYIRCLDARDHATYSQLFAKDGELTFAQGHAIGPKAIRELMEDGERKADPARTAAMASSVHVLTDLSIHLNGDQATAHSRWTLIVRTEGRPVVSASGHYSDALIRENGAWKFKKREIVADLFGQPNSSCDRGCLQTFVTQYLDALVAHNPGAVPAAANVRFTEDTAEMKLGASPLWKNAARLRPYRLDILDVRQGVAASQVIVEESGAPVMLMLRLKVADKKITEVETQITRNKTEGSIFDVDALQSPSKAMLLTPDASQRNSREDAIKIAEHYPAGLKIGSFVKVDAPFASDAYRFENGRLMAGPGCTFMPGCVDIKSQKLPTLSEIKHRVAAVDEELGIVLLRMDFGKGSSFVAGSTLMVWEAFKVYGGQIHAVEAFMKNMPYGTLSGWD
jgi:SnoaL-like domain